jgi:predicted type IV restriction endonuclease
MITNARNLTLSDLRKAFGLRLSSIDSFFEQWLADAPSLVDSDIQHLNHIAQNYAYLSQEDSPLEEINKLVVLSPLLDLAGFYQAPFLPKTEVSTILEIPEDSDHGTIQGKIDVLIMQDEFWVLVIEAKPAKLDVTAGIPQALTYLLGSPSANNPYGMVTNGREVIFLKLDRTQPTPNYSKSIAYRLLDSTQERQEILQGLYYIAQTLRHNSSSKDHPNKH